MREEENDRILEDEENESVVEHFKLRELDINKWDLTYIVSNLQISKSPP